MHKTPRETLSDPRRPRRNTYNSHSHSPVSISNRTHCGGGDNDPFVLGCLPTSGRDGIPRPDKTNSLKSGRDTLRTDREASRKGGRSCTCPLPTLTNFEKALRFKLLGDPTPNCSQTAPFTAHNKTERVPLAPPATPARVLHQIRACQCC